MGKAYVFVGASEVRVRSMASMFIDIVKRRPYRRRAEMSIIYQKPDDPSYRVIVDVCGFPSAEIDSVHAAIQESERS